MPASRFEAVAPGFQQPALDAQAVFRTLLEAMSHPGRVTALPAVLPEAPQGLYPAAAAVCLTLLDDDTPLWTDADAASAIVPWLRFHCGCPLEADPGRALFGLITDPRRLPALDAFSQGSDEAPETAATLIVQVDSLAPHRGCRLRGPGIPEARAFGVGGLSSRFWEQRQAVCEAFPLGLDLIFAGGGELAALPRTTRVDA